MWFPVLYFGFLMTLKLLLGAIFSLFTIVQARNIPLVRIRAFNIKKSPDSSKWELLVQHKTSQFMVRNDSAANSPYHWPLML